ncbi:hypothetical protein [Mesorhizobium sp. A556]
MTPPRLTAQEARTLARNASRWWPILINAGQIAEAEHQRADAELYARMAEKIQTERKAAA